MSTLVNFKDDNAEEFFSGLEASTVNTDIGVDLHYEEVEMDSETEAEEYNESEDFDATLRSIQKLTFLLGKSKGLAAGHSTSVKTCGEVMDDFVRNFLIANGCVKTVECFETEWFELKEKGKLLDSQLGQPPDEYTRSLQIQEVLSKVKDQLQQATVLAHCRQEMTDKFRKERNLHRMHHNRIAQEKNKLIADIKRLQKHYAKYEPVITTLKHKYESAVRAKAMLKLDRDKLQTMMSVERSLLRCLRGKGKSSTGFNLAIEHIPFESFSWDGLDKAGLGKEDETESVTSKEAGPEPPPLYMGKSDPLVMVRPDRRTIIDNTPKPSNVQKFILKRTFRGHSVSVSNLVIHPKKPVVVTASDDATWRMWALPAGDLIMTGEGHKDWVAGLSLHPSGMQLASSSGDCSVKIWSFEKARCIHTFSDHTQAVWAVAYHDSGAVLGSSSLDHTSRIWDLESMKCRGTLRGHVDSVNSVVWQSYSSILCTSSSDKTVSLWDARNALCVQTFYGHEASCNHATFNPMGSMIASADADGVVKLWDVRKVMESSTINVGPHSANKCCFDGSGAMLAIASNDGHIKCFRVDGDVAPVNDLLGHEGSVQALVFDPPGKFLISGGSDGTFRVWA